MIVRNLLAKGASGCIWEMSAENTCLRGVSEKGPTPGKWTGKAIIDQLKDTP